MKGINIFRLFLIISCTLFVTNGLRAEAVFQAFLSNNQVAVNQNFKLTYKVSGGKMEQFAPPDLSNFMVLGGPNRGSSMSIVNGSVSMEQSISYILRAKKAGKYEIQGVEAIIDGNSMTCDALTIQVSANGQNATAAATGQTSQNAKNGQTEKSGDDDIFILATVSKRNLYLNQHFVVTYKLYSRVDIIDYEFLKFPELNGFWNKAVKNINSNGKIESYKGRQYRAFLIHQVVAFPQRTGKLKIDPFEMSFVYHKKIEGAPRDIFEMLQGRYEKVKQKIKSPVITVNVKELPSGAPDGFKGAVGKYTMTSNISKNKVKANEAIDVNIKVAGNGNLPLIEGFDLSMPSDFEVYDPKIADNTAVSAGGINGSKEFSYLTIPRYPGSFDVPPIRFVFFDPGKKKYKVIEGKPIHFDVERDSSQVNNTVIGSEARNKEKVKLLGNDIRYIHLNTSLKKTDHSWMGSLLFYSFLALAPLLFFAILMVKNLNSTQKIDAHALKFKQAKKVVKSRLKIASSHLDSNNKNAFYEAISVALYGYVSDKLQIPVSDLKRETIGERLTTLNVEQTTTQKLIDTLSYCDMVRFAPVEAKTLNEIYADASDIIRNLETAIKS